MVTRYLAFVWLLCPLSLPVLCLHSASRSTVSWKLWDVHCSLMKLMNLMMTESYSKSTDKPQELRLSSLALSSAVLCSQVHLTTHDLSLRAI
ncbi:hypothetical protein V8F20_010074 [Naviculisporaceae sp. PSN 640]